MSHPQRAPSSAEFRDFHSDLASMRVKTERMAELAKEMFGPDADVTYQSEDVSNSLQRLEWALLRIELTHLSKGETRVTGKKPRALH
jgi:hypothetical protein